MGCAQKGKKAMRQIIKFFEITAEQVLALDTVLATKEVAKWANRLRVRSTENSGRYLYEIEVVMVDTRKESQRILFESGLERRTITTHVSRKVMNAIYDALGTFPQEESTEKTDWR